MRIATFNVNSIKARLPRVLDWLDAAAPDVVLLQETKTTAEAFPREAFEDRGYAAAVVGQKTYNGVAILARASIEDVTETLPGDAEDSEARYVEALIDGRVRVASVYVPNGGEVDSDKYRYKLRFLERLRHRVMSVLDWEEQFVLGGDFNVAPQPEDVHDPARWQGRILFSQPERAGLRALLHLGLTDGLRAVTPEPGIYTWWDYRGGAWARDHGVRIDHLLLSPQAADRLADAGVDRAERGREKASDHAPVWCVLRA